MEGEITEVEREIASKINFLKDMVEYPDEEDIIPLFSIKKSILLKVIEYCKYINTNPHPIFEKPFRGNNLEDHVSPWFVQYLNIEKEEFHELLLAANSLDIQSLFELCAAKV